MQLYRVIQNCIILSVCISMQVTIRDFLPTVSDEVFHFIHIVINRNSGYVLDVKHSTSTLISVMLRWDVIISLYKTC